MDQIIKKDNLPVTIAVIGGGFCGILTAIHLMNYGKLKAQLYIINKGYPLVKGVAYNPHTLSLLLNVPNGKMSAFPDQPDHYVKWLKNENPHYAEENNLSSAFSTRQEYGNYLSHLWEHAINKIDSNKTINIVNDYADDITKDNGLLHISLREGRILVADVAILATGNANPGIPNGITRSMLKSKYYFANPWNKSCVENINTQGDILIIGAGLTAIDTIIGIKQRDFQDRIHTISPNGYRIKSWQEDKTPYTSAYMTEIVNENTSLLQLLRFFNKHRKIAMSLDQSVYAIVDSFRPHTQKIWQSL
ncbi:MAG TPA: FAD/NAD(P)-binding protein, partial [Mucilaginibacter sp.]